MFEIQETIEQGLFLRIYDSEVADAFDDFLSEECYVLSEIKFEKSFAVFYFGVLGSKEKLQNLIEAFEKKHGD